MLKVFRRLEPGLNPDIEIHAALQAAGGRHIAALLGSVGAEHRRDAALSLGDAAGVHDQRRPTAGSSAKASVRDLMAEADLHADEAGGDFAAESRPPGRRGRPRCTPTWRARSAPSAVDRRRAARRAPRGCTPGSTSRLTRRTRLAEFEPGLRARRSRRFGRGLRRRDRDCNASTATCTSARCCAPSHRWMISTSRASRWLDLQSRRLPTSPLRDVAGMLRSFDYAAVPSRRRVRRSASSSTYRANEWVAAQPRRVLRRLRRGRRCRPPRHADPAARVRGRQGGLRGRLRGAQPARPGCAIPLASPEPVWPRAPHDRRCHHAPALSGIGCTTTTTISRSELGELVGGAHHNPHGILGAHPQADGHDRRSAPCARRQRGRP